MSNTDVPSGKFCKSLINSAAIFTEEIYDMTLNQLEAYIEANSRNDFVYIKFNYKQLRRSKKWFKDQCRALNNDMKAIRREILIEWTASSDVNPFEESQILALEDFMANEINTIMLREVYALFEYEKLDPEVSYIVSVDVSGGLALDSSVICFSDPVDLKTTAIMKSNKIDTPELEEVIKLLVQMFPNIIVVIERNSYGLSVIQHLEKDPKVKKRLFYTEEKQKNGIKKRIGVNTDTKTRPLMIECFKLLVVDSPQCIISKYIIEEVKTLEIKRGKIQSMDGEHDDCIMAKAFSSYVQIHYGHILKRFTSLGKKSIQRAMIRISSHNKKRDKNNLSEKLIDDMINKEMIKKQIISQRKPTEIYNILSLNKKGSKLPTSIQVRPQNIDWFSDMQKKEKENEKKIDN